MSVLDELVRGDIYWDPEISKAARAELEALRAENAKLTASNLDFIRANNEVGNLNANLQAENAKLRAEKEILRDLLMEHAPGINLSETLKEVK